MKTPKQSKDKILFDLVRNEMIGTTRAFPELKNFEVIALTKFRKDGYPRYSHRYSYSDENGNADWLKNNKKSLFLFADEKSEDAWQGEVEFKRVKFSHSKHMGIKKFAVVYPKENYFEV